MPLTSWLPELALEETPGPDSEHEQPESALHVMVDDPPEATRSGEALTFTELALHTPAATAGHCPPVYPVALTLML